MSWFEKTDSREKTFFTTKQTKNTKLGILPESCFGAFVNSG